MYSILRLLGFVSLFAVLALASPACPNTLAFNNPNLRTSCNNASQFVLKPGEFTADHLIFRSVVHPSSSQVLRPITCTLSFGHTTLLRQEPVPHRLPRELTPRRCDHRLPERHPYGEPADPGLGRRQHLRALHRPSARRQDPLQLRRPKLHWRRRRKRPPGRR